LRRHMQPKRYIVVTRYEFLLALHTILDADSGRRGGCAWARTG
jgi:hypothetical protein